MIEKNEFHSNNNFEDEMNFESRSEQRRDKTSRKKKQSSFDEYDLRTLMDDYYHGMNNSTEGLSAKNSLTSEVI